MPGEWQSHKATASSQVTAIAHIRIAKRFLAIIFHSSWEDVLSVVNVTEVMEVQLSWADWAKT